MHNAHYHLLVEDVTPNIAVLMEIMYSSAIKAVVKWIFTYVKGMFAKI